MGAIALGTTPDPQREVDLSARAADVGNAEAAYNLAAMHATGRFGDVDFPSALRWYRRSADLAVSRANDEHTTAQ